MGTVDRHRIGVGQLIQLAELVADVLLLIGTHGELLLIDVDRDEEKPADRQIRHAP